MISFFLRIRGWREAPKYIVQKDTGEAEMT